MPRPAKEADQSTFAGRVALRIVTERLKARLSVEEACARAGVIPPRWHEWEKGREMPLAALPKIAEGLGCKVAKLMPDE